MSPTGVASVLTTDYIGRGGAVTEHYPQHMDIEIRQSLDQLFCDIQIKTILTQFVQKNVANVNYCIFHCDC